MADVLWAKRHAHAERFCARAKVFADGGNKSDADRAYLDAAEMEMKALAKAQGPAEIGISVVTAVSAYLLAGARVSARTLVASWIERVNTEDQLRLAALLAGMDGVNAS